jgi:hypothetical protein
MSKFSVLFTITGNSVSVAVGDRATDMMLATFETVAFHSHCSHVLLLVLM